MFLSASFNLDAPAKQGIRCVFKGVGHHLEYPIRLSRTTMFQRGGLSPAQLDTASHYYDVSKFFVEIIRQDDPVSPRIGIDLGFEFDENNGEYPFTPSNATLNFKDFGWGGKEFELGDTLNYTGVSNAVSDDILVEVLSWKNDTITGRFSGLLLNGAGNMAVIDSGWFRVRLFRK